ncbi:hypothetical protein GYMLUDRAFT_157386, partial [Collybiopsis luxurians FD-317 M1]
TLHQDKATLKVTNIFGLPGQERKLLSHIHKVCSNVKNQLHINICDSIIKTLEAFTYDAALKYK